MTFRLSATTVRQLREELICPDEQERFAFVDAGTKGTDDLLAHRVDTVSDEAMARQSEATCRPAPAVERDHISSCYDEQLAPILTHSHPFSSDPNFSSIDVESMGRFQEWLTGLFPNEDFGFAVIGTDGIEAVANEGDNRLRALDIEIVGEWKLDDPVPGMRSRFDVENNQSEHVSQTEPSNRVDKNTSRDGGTQSPDNRLEEDVSVEHACSDRFDRSIRAFGIDGQRRLEDTTVGIVGVGGLGSIVAEQLARLGVSDFVLIDPDLVEESNLSRLVGVFNHHIGKSKVAAIREHLWQSGNGNVDVEIHQEQVQDIPDQLDRCDAIVGCVDSVTARSFCNEYAVKHLTYYIDAGVRIDTTDDQEVEMSGYVHLVAPGSNACFDCLGRHDQAAARLEQLSPEERDVERERGYIDDDQLTPEPAVIHLNGSCASKAVSVLVDLITGRSVPPDFIRYEDTENELAELTTSPSRTCPTCGKEGVLGVGRRSFGDAHFEPDKNQDPATSD